MKVFFHKSIFTHPFFSTENGGKLHVFPCVTSCARAHVCNCLYSEKRVFVCKSTLLQDRTFVCVELGRIQLVQQKTGLGGKGLSLSHWWCHNHLARLLARLE